MLIRNQPGDYAESDTTDLPVAALALGLMLGGCFTQNYQRGWSRRVQRIANYRIQHGKVFDSVSRTTPTGGQELNDLTDVFRIFDAKEWRSNA